MNAAQLLAHFDRLSEAPDALPRLRRFILDLAVRGKLVEQDPKDEPALALLKRIQAEKARLVKLGLAKTGKPLPEIEEADAALIPAAWRWSRLAEVGFISPRNAAADDQLVSFVSMPMIAADYGTPNLQEVRPWREIKSGYTHFAEGDVGLAKITPCFENGKSTVFRGLMNGIGAGTTELHIVRPILLSADYILIFLKSSRYIATGIPRMKGTAGQKRVPTEYFTHSPFPLPPLAEQHRIVAQVDELMALCDQLEAAQQERERRRDRLSIASLQRLNQQAADATPETQRENARFHLHHLPRLTTRPEHIKAMRQTILNFAVHGWLVPQVSNDGGAATLLNEALANRKATWESEQVNRAKASGKVLGKDWQKKYTEPVHAEGLFSLPSKWVWASTLEVCECVENGNTPSPHEMTDGNGEIPFIKVYNLTKTGDLDFTVKPTFIPRKVHDQKLQRSRILPGDVLMNIVGPPLGKVSLVTDQFPEWNTNQAVVLFRPSQVLLPKYLTLCLLSDGVLTWITRLAQATVGQSNISVSKSRALPIPLPPLAEQHRIIAKVEELMALCDQLEVQVNIAQTGNQRLLEAVLGDALSA